MDKKIKAIVKIQGGLGNQLFTYAFGQVLKDRGIEVYYDISSYKTFYMPYVLYKFNVEVPNADDFLIKTKMNIFKRILRRLFSVQWSPYKNYKYFLNNVNIYNPKALDIKQNTYYDGYWESEKYWGDSKEKILKQFTLINGFSQDSLDFLNQIEICDNSVALHIRRGDKAYIQSINSVHGLDSLSYYYAAIKLIESKIKEPTYFVFTDDMPYAKNNLKINGKVVFIDKKIDDEEEFIIMSKCKHKITASSSYSWWAAILGESNDGIIIAPNKYTDKLDVEPAPDRWIKIDNK